MEDGNRNILQMFGFRGKWQNIDNYSAQRLICATFIIGEWRAFQPRAAHETFHANLSIGTAGIKEVLCP